VVFTVVFFFVFFTLVSGPRHSLRLKPSDTGVYEPRIRARLGTTEGEAAGQGAELATFLDRIMTLAGRERIADVCVRPLPPPPALASSGGRRARNLLSLALSPRLG